MLRSVCQWLSFGVSSVTMKYIALVVVVVLVWSGASALGTEDAFTKQLKQLVHELRMPSARIQDVMDLKWTLETTLGTRWPGCQVNLIGSVLYGLAMLFSDMDCIIILPIHVDNSYESITPVTEEAKKLLQQQPGFFNFFTWTNLTIPVLSFEHAPTKMAIDVSFNNHDERIKSLLVKYLLHDKKARYLAFITKFWFNTTGHPFLQNHGLILLVIFYLQQKHVLPSIASLQENAAPFMIEEWNFGFDHLEYKSQNNDYLSSIIGGFFTFYGEFDFKNYIVSPYVGYPVPKSAFKHGKNVPAEFKLYKQNLMSERSQPLSVTDDMMIQDLFIHNAHINNAEELSSFRALFKDADVKFQKDPQAFLRDLQRGKSFALHRVISTWTR